MQSHRDTRDQPLAPGELLVSGLKGALFLRLLNETLHSETYLHHAFFSGQHGARLADLRAMAVDDSLPSRNDQTDHDVKPQRRGVAMIALP